jgi:hypothetical protein
MSSFKLSPMVITTMFVFVALMSMQLIVTSTVEGATHTNENHRKFTKNRFLVSNSMEGGSRRQLINLCSQAPCMGGQTCCPDPFGPLFNICIPGLGADIGSCIECNDPCPVGALCCSIPLYSICIGHLEDINNCGACNNKCSVGQQCCSGQCVNTLTNSTNCGGCGHVCNNVPCTLGICGGYGS